MSIIIHENEIPTDQKRIVRDKLISKNKMMYSKLEMKRKINRKIIEGRKLCKECRATDKRSEKAKRSSRKYMSPEPCDHRRIRRHS